MKAKKIYETLSDVLKPKSTEEIDSVIGGVKELLDDCYELIETNDDFLLTSDIGVQKSKFGFRTFYGFTFESRHSDNKFSVETNGDYLDLIIHYGTDEFDYTQKEIRNLGDFIFRLNIYDQINDEDFVYEDLNTIFKGKTYDELKPEFEKKFPYFTNIFRVMFPGKEFNIGMTNDPYFGFKEGEITFLVTQNEHMKFPAISHLEPRESGDGFGGFFKGQRTVRSKEEVMRYVNDILNN